MSKKDQLGSNNPNHKHGLSHTKLWHTYKNMRSRCTNPNRPDFKHYGGGGIKVCSRWLNGDEQYSGFEYFVLDMGTPETILTLERLDNNKDYAPDNCVWETRATQSGNRRTNIWLEHDGKKLTVTQWAKELDIPISTLFSRLTQSKWSVEKALTTPIRRWK